MSLKGMMIRKIRAIDYDKLNKLASDIGKRNAEAVKRVLKEENIPIVAEHTGGNKGRTMIVNSEDGVVSIRIVGQGIITL